MTPREISQIDQQVPEQLKVLFKTKKVYGFLREKVEIHVNSSNAHITPHLVPCEKCCNPVPHDMLLISPYNGPHPGWCIACVLRAFFADEPLYDKYRDPRSKYYDTVYGKQYRTWNDFELEFGTDYDGPPIAWG